MSGAALKILAMTAMFLDHIGVIFFPQVIWIRLVGRISFPIFCFFVAEGADKTHDQKEYWLRLLLFALVSELPFQWAFYGRTAFSAQNVGFTLLLGLTAIILTDWLLKKSFPISLFAAIVIAGAVTAAELLHTDYRAFGVALCLLFYYSRQSRALQMILFTALTLVGSLSGYMWRMEYYAILAVIPLLCYNGKKGKGGKSFRYFFYVFYPVHLILLCAICKIFAI